MKTALVLGGGGFIGSHLVADLVNRDYWVRAADLHFPEFGPTYAYDFQVVDLRVKDNVDFVLDLPFDEVYQLAADMGGAGFVFTGENDADIIHNSALINLHVAKRVVEMKVGRLFFSSSACAYPDYNQKDPAKPCCREDSIFPAKPDSVYGWEKLFSEIMYQSFRRNFKLDVRIARFHNIFGEEGTWKGGREKAPAALCRKVAEAPSIGDLEIWGDGRQTRSFLYIDECLEGVRRLMQSDCLDVVNIGSEEMISIGDLARMVIRVSGKSLTPCFDLTKPVGVAGRNSDNTLIRAKLGWAPSQPLVVGIRKLYKWVLEQVNGNN